MEPNQRPPILSRATWAQGMIVLGMLCVTTVLVCGLLAWSVRGNCG